MAERFLTRAGTAADDAALRRLLRDTPVQGGLRVCLEREPSFFGGDIDGLRHDVATVWRGAALAACGSRVVRRAWWGGVPSDAAYLCDLRLHPSWQRRGGRALVEGYRHLEGCGEAAPAVVTWTAVFEENHAARGSITGSRAGLPAYIERGKLLCPVFFVRRGSLALPAGVTTGRSGDAEEVAEFLNARHRTRLLAPVHAAADLLGTGRWPGLEMKDFLLLREAGRLTGVVAIYDVRGIRQVRLEGLSGWKKWLRRPLNAAAMLTGWPPLPEDGSVLPMAYASFLAVENDDAALAGLLLRCARTAAHRRGIHFLCACLHDQDPLLPAFRGMPAITSHGSLYEVVSGNHAPAWMHGVPHIEAAGL